MAFIKRLFDAGKKVVAGGYTGLKTGLIVGRALIDVSKVVARDLQFIPQLRETLQKYLNSENLREADEIVKKGQSATKIVDAVRGARGRRQLEQPD